MNKNKIFSVVIIGGVAVAALYILTKSGTLQEAVMGGGGTHAGYASQDGDAGPATIYQFPAEPAVNFPTLPTFQEVFQPPATMPASLSSLGITGKGPSYSEVPFLPQEQWSTKKTTSSSTSLNVNEAVGGGILTGILGMIMGPVGFAAGPAVALAGQTEIGASVKSTIGGALSSSKKEITSSMGGFGSSGSPASTLTPYQSFLSTYVFGAGGSYSGSKKSSSVSGTSVESYTSSGTPFANLAKSTTPTHFTSGSEAASYLKSQIGGR